MPKASDIKRGDIVEYKNGIYQVKQLEAKSPSSRGANTLYKMRLIEVTTKQKVDESFTGDDMLKQPDFSRVNVQYLYDDGEFYTFMNSEDYSQYQIAHTDLEDQSGYLIDGLEGIIGLQLEENLIGIDLPASVNLEITETSPGIKGASASARTKPATLSTGLVVQVPEYLDTGEVIKVNTSNGQYMSRA